MSLLTAYTIHQAHLEDISFFLGEAQHEGWNPGLHDAIPFYKADPHGFFIGELNGEKIGCISAVAYNSFFGFLGFYIVKPAHRHQGYGFKLWQHALDYLRHHVIGLDGVIEQQDNYKKSGFKFYYRNIRFTGQGGGPFPSTLIDLHAISFDNLLAYDTSVFGVDRARFLQKWINMPNAYCLGILKHDQLVGYGIARECVKGYKIGPLFADTPEIAQEIYQGLRAKIGSFPFYFDVPEINVEAVKIAQQAQMQKVFETARMYNQPPPLQPMEKVYGVTTFELG